MNATWNPDFKPEAALKFFRRKGLQASFAWQDMWQEEHENAFTVAKMMDLDLLRDMKESVDQAISNGETFDTFRKKVQPELMKRGWWGRADMTDPLTGETKEVQLGSVRRLETIFTTNMQTSYAAGSWEQITDTAEHAPYLMYDHLDGQAHPRPEHAKWDGLVLRWDDDFWKTHYPPNGWHCHCTVIQLSQEDVKRQGLSISDSAPPKKTREYTNPRSGDITRVPVGIDPGFGYSPGAESLRGRALQNFGDKVAAAPAALGATAWASLMEAKPSLRVAFDDAWSRWVSLVKDRAKPQREWFVVGSLAPTDVAFLGARNITPVSAEIAAEDRLIVGAKAERHVTQGNTLSVDEMKLIPTALREPEAVLFDEQNETLLYVIAGGDRKNKIVVQPDFQRSKPKAQLNAVRTAFKVPGQNLRESRYVVVRGGLK